VRTGEKAVPEPESQPVGEITNLKEFRQVIAKAEGVIVVTGSKPPKAHTPFCDLLSDDRFNQNVVLSEKPTVKYYWRSTLIDARRELGAVPCKKCRPPEMMKLQPVSDS
jgi:hypothetical protein